MNAITAHCGQRVLVLNYLMQDVNNEPVQKKKLVNFMYYLLIIKLFGTKISTNRSEQLTVAYPRLIVSSRQGREDIIQGPQLPALIGKQ